MLQGSWAHPRQVLLFGSTGSEELRPIEVVESVLWDDRKVNTYKFALFRAIADKWIGYYWPLM